MKDGEQINSKTDQDDKEKIDREDDEDESDQQEQIIQPEVPNEFYMKAQQIVFKEHMIDSGPELASVSKLYFKQSKKLAIELAGGKEKFKKKMQLQIEQSESSDNDEDGDLIDNLYVQDQYAGTQDKRVEKLMKQFEESEKNGEKDPEETADEGKEDSMDQLINEQNDNNLNLSKNYKLFNYICKQTIEQVIRYISPMHFKFVPGYYTLDPLWASNKNML